MSQLPPVNSIAFGPQIDQIEQYETIERKRKSEALGELTNSPKRQIIQDIRPTPHKTTEVFHKAKPVTFNEIANLTSQLEGLCITEPTDPLEYAKGSSTYLESLNSGELRFKDHPLELEKRNSLKFETYKNPDNKKVYTFSKPEQDQSSAAICVTRILQDLLLRTDNLTTVYDFLINNNVLTIDNEMITILGTLDEFLSPDFVSDHFRLTDPVKQIEKTIQDTGNSVIVKKEIKNGEPLWYIIDSITDQGAIIRKGLSREIPAVRSPLTHLQKTFMDQDCIYILKEESSPIDFSWYFKNTNTKLPQLQSQSFESYLDKEKKNNIKELI